MQIGSQIYDPSYGTGPFSSILDWENDIKMKDVEETFIITIQDDGKVFINDKEKKSNRINDYTTEADKARISKLKEQKL